MSGKLDEFFDQFTFYLCKSCDTATKEWYPNPGGWTELDKGAIYHHSGEIIRHLGAFSGADLFDSLMRAYAAYLPLDDNPAGIETLLCDAAAGPTPLDLASDPEIQALRYFWDGRDKTFVIHGLEDVSSKFRGTYQRGNRFPPLHSLMPLAISKSRSAYAIETDKPPFQYCAQHHGIHSVFPWVYCQGMITFEDFRSLGGRIIKSGEREHFYAASDIPAENWHFAYDLSFQRISTAAHRHLQFSPTELSQSIDELISSGLPAISKQTVRKFFRLTSLLQQKLDLLECCEFI